MKAIQIRPFKLSHRFNSDMVCQMPECRGVPDAAGQRVCPLLAQGDMAELGGVEKLHDQLVARFATELGARAERIGDVERELVISGPSKCRHLGCKRLGNCDESAESALNSL